MYRLITLMIILSVTGYKTFAQIPFEKQSAVAESFLNFILKGQKEQSWLLFDKENVTNVNHNQFEVAFTQIKNGLAMFDTFSLTTTISRHVNNKVFNIYVFKALSQTKHILNDVFVDLTFSDTSSLVGGMQWRVKPRDSTSLTSNNNETPIAKQFAAEIDGVSYKIRGVNIVHFDKNTGLLAIQIERKISSQEFEKQEWAKKEAIKFAKYLVAQSYVEKAKAMAKELSINLVEDLGVSFRDPDSKSGVNVKLTLEDLK